jgi:hypothetical protein
MTISNTSPIFAALLFVSGQKALFFNPNGEEDQSFNFSSTLEKVGVEWDCTLKNNSIVIVLSEPVEIDSPKYGNIWLTKIKANMATDFHTIIGEFWVPTITLVDIEDER